MSSHSILCRCISLLLLLSLAVAVYSIDFGEDFHNLERQFVELGQTRKKARENPIQLKPPKMTLSRDDFRREFFEFNQAIQRCPIYDGDRFSGMMSSHALGFWTILRKMQPEIVIENGVRWGFSTWLIRQALPNARIISIDPSPFPLLYRDSNTLYFMGENFRDFTEIDWDELGVDREKTLILFDDHKDTFRRLKEARARGFLRVVYDDNTIIPDCYSLKSLVHQPLHSTNEKNEDLVPYTDNALKTFKMIPLSEHEANKRELFTFLRYYYEVPPFFWYSGYEFPKVKQYIPPQVWTDMMSTAPLFSYVEEPISLGWKPALEKDWQKDVTWGYHFMCYVEIDP